MDGRSFSNSVFINDNIKHRKEIRKKNNVIWEWYKIDYAFVGRNSLHCFKEQILKVACSATATVRPERMWLKEVPWWEEIL